MLLLRCGERQHKRSLSRFRPIHVVAFFLELILFRNKRILNVERIIPNGVGRSVGTQETPIRLASATDLTRVRIRLGTLTKYTPLRHLDLRLPFAGRVALAA